MKLRLLVIVSILLALGLSLTGSIARAYPNRPYQILNAIDIVSPTEWWAVGESGALLHYNQGAWQTMTLPGTPLLRDISMISAEEGWAVGERIFHYQNGVWQAVESPFLNGLTAVDMLSADEGWAVGYDGIIIHYDGSVWQAVESPFQDDLTAVDMLSADEGWTVGHFGAIFHYQNGAWQQVDSPSTLQLYDVDMISPEEGWAVGEEGLLHYTNGTWQKIIITDPLQSLYTIDMVSADEGWAMGWKGGIDPNRTLIFYYQGGVWQQVASPLTDSSIIDIQMISAGEGWAIGDGGLLLHYVDGAWQTGSYTVTGTVTDIYDTPIDRVRLPVGWTGAETTTGGNYTISNLFAGTYDLLPSRPGFTFSPQARTITVPPQVEEQDFTLLPPNDMVFSLNEIGRIESNLQVDDFLVEGDYAYLSLRAPDNSENSLYIFDISQPATPTLVGTTAFQVETPNKVSTLAKAGHYLYASQSYSPGHIVDVSDPANPLVVNVGGLEGYVSMAVKDHLAYGVQRGSPRWVVDILDVSAPKSPVVIGALTSPESPVAAMRFSQPYLVHDHLVFIYSTETCHIGGCEPREVYLDVVNIADPFNPTFASSTQLDYVEAIFDIREGLCTHPKLVVKDQTGYFAENSCADPNILHILDLSTPASPVEAGQYQLFSDVNQMATSDDFLYLASGTAGLRMLHISDLNAPREIGVYGPTMQGVAVADNRVYASHEYGLTILPHDSTVTGQVKDLHNTPFPGVQLSTSAGLTVTTGSQGGFALGLPEGTHTLTPSLTGYAFEPPSRTVTVPPNASNQDFTILPKPVSTTLSIGSGTASLPTTLSFTDTQGLPTHLHFPPGAVSQPTTVTLTPTLAIPADDLTFTGHAFLLQASQPSRATFQFDAPIQVTIHYSQDDVRLVSDEASLSLYQRTAEDWREAVQSCPSGSALLRQEGENILTATICQSGYFALFGPTNRTFLPVVFRSG